MFQGEYVLIRVTVHIYISCVLFFNLYRVKALKE